MDRFGEITPISDEKIDIYIFLFVCFTLSFSMSLPNFVSSISFHKSTIEGEIEGART